MFPLFILLIYSNTKIHAQEKFAIQVEVRGKDSEMPVSNFSISIKNLSEFIASHDGTLKFKAATGVYYLAITHVSFDTLRAEISIKSDSTFRFFLKPRGNIMKEVRISSHLNTANAVPTGIHRLTKRDFESMPAFLGEKDPVKLIQTLPGIGKGGEANSGLFVRGATAGQNLTLFNEAVLYNPSHLLGFFSVFNADAVESVKLYKSGIPPEFGGRLSSVMEVNSSKKVADSTSAKINLSLIGVNGSVSAPITKNWSVSGSLRKTFMNTTVWPIFNKYGIGSKVFNKMKYDFYDFNFISNANIGKNNRVSISGYRGKDNFGFLMSAFSVANKMDWGNSGSSVIWDKRVGKGNLIHTALTYSSYDFKFGMEQEKYAAQIASSINDYSLKSYLSFAGKSYRSKVGFQYSYHHFKPNSPHVETGETELDYGPAHTYNSDELAVFSGHEIELNNKLAAYLSLRFTNYRHLGPYTSTSKQAGSTVYSKFSKVYSYNYFEPGLTARYKLNGASAIKLSFARNAQPLHLVSITSVNFPTDFWIPSIKNIKPETASQVTAGYFLNLFDQEIETSIDFYYKSFANQIEFSGGMMNLLDNLKIEDNLLFGKGNAFGSEIFLKKRGEKFSGWLSYTLGKSSRTFAGLNQGNPFPYKYDRRHDLSLTGVLNMNKKLKFSSLFTYASGNAYTQPAGRYIISGNIVNEYSSYNGARMPAYHRLDLSVSYGLRETSRTKNRLTFSVYNLYSRKNPIYIFFLAKGDLNKYQVSVQPKSVALLPMLPSISWSYNFN